MRYRVSIILATLLFVSRAASQTVPAAAAPDSREQLVAQIRAAYDSGFAALMAIVPTSVRDSSSSLRLLWQIGRFRKQAVAWARMDGNSYLAVSPGPRMPAWLAVVPPGSEALTRMHGTLQLDPTATILVAQMAPEPVTPTWGAVFLTQQLSLLASYVQGDTLGDSATARIDLQAAYIEFVAGDFLAHGRLRTAIDTLFARWKPQSTSEAAHRIVRTDRSVLRALQATVSDEPARSRAEAELRGGFVATSMAVRFCELHDLPANQCATLVHQIPSAF